MTSVFENHERIWLEPCEPVDNIEGRMWCEDNQWGKDGVEYIRADLLSALTNTSGDDEAPVAKVVSKYGDPESFGERDLVALVDLSTLKYNTLLYARPQSAAVRDGWQPIKTAPKGEVTEDAGCRGASEWFLGRVAPKYAAFRPPYIVIRRRAWPQEDSWSCAGEADYVPAFFDAWAPISAALSSEGTNGHR